MEGSLGVWHLHHRLVMTPPQVPAGSLRGNAYLNELWGPKAKFCEVRGYDGLAVYQDRDRNFRSPQQLCGLQRTDAVNSFQARSWRSSTLWRGVKRDWQGFGSLSRRGASAYSSTLVLYLALHDFVTMRKQCWGHGPSNNYPRCSRDYRPHLVHRRSTPDPRAL